MSEEIKIDDEGYATDDDTDDGTEDEKPKKKSKRSDFVKVISNMVGSLNIKVAFFLFFIGMIIFSDVFIDGFLSSFPDSSNGDCTTTKGTMIQLTLFVMAYLVLDLLVQADWI